MCIKYKFGIIFTKLFIELNTSINRWVVNLPARSMTWVQTQPGTLERSTTDGIRFNSMKSVNHDEMHAYGASTVCKNKLN